MSRNIFTLISLHLYSYTCISKPVPLAIIMMVVMSSRYQRFFLQIFLKTYGSVVKSLLQIISGGMMADLFQTICGTLMNQVIKVIFYRYYYEFSMPLILPYDITLII